MFVDLPSDRDIVALRSLCHALGDTDGVTRASLALEGHPQWLVWAARSVAVIERRTGESTWLVAERVSR